MKFGHFWPEIFQSRKYFYKATVELCGQENRHLASVDSTVAKAGPDLSAQVKKIHQHFFAMQFEAEFHFAAFFSRFCDQNFSFYYINKYLTKL